MASRPASQPANQPTVSCLGFNWRERLCGGGGGGVRAWGGVGEGGNYMLRAGVCMCKAGHHFDVQIAMFTGKKMLCAL